MNRAPGTDVSEARTSTEALTIAKLDWRVNTAPLFVLSKDPQNYDAMMAVNSAKAIVREQDGKVLGVVGKLYEPVQNDDMFSIADILAQDEGVKFARAGSFDGGSRLFLSLQLPGDIRLGNKQDVVQKYLTLVNSHNGTSALTGLINAIRLFCTNQLPNLVHSGRMKAMSSDHISIRHTRNADQKLVIARETLGQAMGFYRSYERVAQKLFETRFTPGQMDGLVKHLFPFQSVTDTGVPTRTLKNRETLLDLFDNGTEHRSAGIQGTAWAALNAVAEFVDHRRSTRVRKGSENDAFEQRTASAWFGTGALMKRRAFDIIAEETGIDVN